MKRRPRLRVVLRRQRVRLIRNNHTRQRLPKHRRYDVCVTYSKLGGFWTSWISRADHRHEALQSVKQ